MLNSLVRCLSRRFSADHARRAMDGAFDLQDLSADVTPDLSNITMRCHVALETGAYARGFRYEWELRDATADGNPVLALLQSNQPAMSLELARPLEPDHLYRLLVRVQHPASGRLRSDTLFFHPDDVERDAARPLDHTRPHLSPSPFALRNLP